jgi:hypothetical protein
LECNSACSVLDEEEENDPIVHRPTSPLGRLILPPRVSLPVRPRDLSTATWLERVSFLEKLKEALADVARFRESPSQIVECVLTTAVPEHKRVVVLIPPILSEMILHHPEVLRGYLPQILAFTLNTMPIEEKERVDPDFEQFVSVLCIEADPNELIENALKLCLKSPRRLPLERIVLKLYELREDVALGSTVVSHLVIWLLNHTGCDRLMEVLCVEEFKLIQRFSVSQSTEVRNALLPYMKKAQAQRASQTGERDVVRVIEVGNDPRQLKRIIEEECSRGPRADIPKYVAALLAFPDEGTHTEFFLRFLRFLAKLPLRSVIKYENDLGRVCIQKFGSPQLVTFLGDDPQDRKLISGLSRCIWKCPSTILDGSEQYLHPLYAIFKRSIGPTRDELAQIFLAIWKKTQHSVLDLEEVCDPHCNLLKDLMAQYKIVED